MSYKFLVFLGLATLLCSIFIAPSEAASATTNRIKKRQQVQGVEDTTERPLLTKEKENYQGELKQKKPEEVGGAEKKDELLAQLERESKEQEKLDEHAAARRRGGKTRAGNRRVRRRRIPNGRVGNGQIRKGNNRRTATNQTRNKNRRRAVRRNSKLSKSARRKLIRVNDIDKRLDEREKKKNTTSTSTSTKAN